MLQKMIELATNLDEQGRKEEANCVWVAIACRYRGQSAPAPVQVVADALMLGVEQPVAQEVC